MCLSNELQIVGNNWDFPYLNHETESSSGNKRHCIFLFREYRNLSIFRIPTEKFEFSKYQCITVTFFMKFLFLVFWSFLWTHVTFFSYNGKSRNQATFVLFLIKKKNNVIYIKSSIMYHYTLMKRYFVKLINNRNFSIIYFKFKPLVNMMIKCTSGWFFLVNRFFFFFKEKKLKFYYIILYYIL